MVKLVKKDASPEADFLPDVLRIADVAASFKAIDLVAYDVRGLTLIADCLIFATVKNEPQLKAVVNGVKDGLKVVGVNPLHVEGALSGGWVIVDYGTIIVHVFRDSTRDFYDLDGMWGDAPTVDLHLNPEDIH